jgi:hypothetical protein
VVTFWHHRAERFSAIDVARLLNAAIEFVAGEAFDGRRLEPLALGERFALDWLTMPGAALEPG